MIHVNKRAEADTMSEGLKEQERLHKACGVSMLIDANRSPDCFCLQVRTTRIDVKGFKINDTEICVSSIASETPDLSMCIN